MKTVITYSVVALAFAFVMWSMLCLSNYAGQVHDRLRQFRQQAEAAQSLADLLRVEAELRA